MGAIEIQAAVLRRQPELRLPDLLQTGPPA